MRRTVKLFILAALASASISSVARSSHVRVPNDNGTIDAAIAHADSIGADSVIVVSGAGYGAFTANKALTVANASHGTVTISGSGGPALNVTTAGAVVDGFTFTGGTGNVVSMTNGVLKNSIVNDGGTAYSGSVISLQFKALISGCTINLTSTTSARAILTSTASGSRITGCTLNIAKSSAGDDEVVRINASSDTVENCTFNCTSSGAVYAIDVSATNALIRDNVIHQAAVGVRLSSSNTAIQRNIFDVDSYGIELLGGTTTCTNNTMYRNSCDSGAAGILASSSSGASHFDNNLIYNFGYGAFYSGGTTDTFSHNIYYGSCASASNRGLGSTEMANKEPLFCESHEAPVQYFTQRMDSEAAPGNNGWDELVGARDVECAWGTLARNTTVAASTSVRVLSDVTVPSSHSLTLNPGVQMSFDTSDNSTGGTDGSKNELIVAGSMTAIGSSGSHIALKSTSSGGSDWFGLIANSGTGPVKLKYVDVTNADYGVTISNAYLDTLDNCSFSNNALYDLKLGSGNTNSVVKNCSVTVGAGTGFSIAEGASIDNNTIVCNSSSTSGIECPSNTGYPSITNNLVYGASNGQAVLVSAGNPQFAQNEFKTSKYGVKLVDGAAAIGTGSSSSDNLIHDNSSYGIYAICSGPSCPAGCFTTAPTVRNNQIYSNSVGVWIQKTANIDLGHAGDNGLNSIYSNSIACINNASSCGQVSARGNWFNTDCSQPLTCTSGSVDSAGVLCSQPSGFSMALAPLPEGNRPLQITGAFPNPLSASTQVRFLVGQQPGTIGAAIFDISGRLVRSFPAEPLSVGQHEMLWDSKDGRGQAVPNGVYFVRLRTERGLQESIRVLVAR